MQGGAPPPAGKHSADADAATLTKILAIVRACLYLKF